MGVLALACQAWLLELNLNHTYIQDLGIYNIYEIYTTFAKITIQFPHISLELLVIFIKLA